jgi:release factor glutamine methyltransferase
MSTSLSLSTRSVIVHRLRSAGCVYAEDEAQLLISSALSPDHLLDMLEQRLAGHPLEHVLGWAEFCGLRVAVATDVFVPRRRTEFLAGQAAALVRPPRAVVVDLCCGSGAVGLAMISAAGARAKIELHAVDIDARALQCARHNLAATDALVYEGDLCQPLPARLRGRVNILVANAPYVPTDAIDLLPVEAREYEPRTALDGGTDGLDVHRRLAALAPEWLVPGGHLLVETSELQAPLTAEAFARYGLIPRVLSCAAVGATVVVGRRPRSRR